MLSAQHDGKEFTMGKIYKNVTEAIGGTPLVELCNMEKKYGLEATILAKLEYLNPAGSTKDRAALWMIEDAERRGLLSEGSDAQHLRSSTGLPGPLCFPAGFQEYFSSFARIVASRPYFFFHIAELGASRWLLSHFYRFSRKSDTFVMLRRRRVNNSDIR